MDWYIRYNIGRKLKLQPCGPSLVASEGFSATTFDAEITRRLQLGKGTRGQVVVIRFYDNPVEEEFVAKFYDPQFCPYDMSCIESKTREVTAYKTLTTMQGKEIPTFFGEFLWFSEDGPAEGISAIVLELINDPVVGTFPPITDANEKAQLKASAIALLKKMHAHEVYHRDIRPSNLFWDHIARLTICDFEAALCKRNSIRAAGWIAEDTSCMMGALMECGLDDDRACRDIPKLRISAAWPLLMYRTIVRQNPCNVSAIKMASALAYASGWLAFRLILIYSSLIFK